MSLRPLLIALLCVTIPLTGCHAMRPVDLAAGDPAQARVAPGDFVRVWMRDGRVLELRLTAVEPDALVGGEQRLPLKDIERVERRSFSAVRTALLVVAIAVGLAVGVGAAVAAGHGFPGIPPGTPH